MLEDDKTYALMPFKGLQRMYMFIQLLTAASLGLLRQPSSEELEAIGAEDYGGFEEYDDFEEKYDDPDIFDTPEPVTEADDTAEPKEITVSIENIQDGLAQCNLCKDTLVVTCPGDDKYGLMSAEDLFYELDLKDAAEENIKQHGGYMIDEWRFVDSRQVPMDLRSRIRFT